MMGLLTTLNIKEKKQKDGKLQDLQKKIRERRGVEETSI